jgi:hypothetical protein
LAVKISAHGRERFGGILEMACDLQARGKKIVTDRHRCSRPRAGVMRGTLRLSAWRDTITGCRDLGKQRSGIREFSDQDDISAY